MPFGVMPGESRILIGPRRVVSLVDVLQAFFTHKHASSGKP